MNMNTRLFTFASLLSLLAIACSPGQTRADQIGVWNFNNNLNNAVPGGSSMVAIGGWTPSYASDTIGGSPATVLSFPAFTNSQALDMPNDAAPNGGSATTTNNWTIVMDVMFPVISPFTALWETDTIGTTDADYFIRDSFGDGTEGALGTSGQYGADDVFAGEWTRIAVSIDVDVNPVTYTVIGYADGDFSMHSSTSSPPDGKEAVEDFLHLFTDDGAETAAGFISSLAFYDEVLTETAIGLLGPASASGIPVTFVPLDGDYNSNGTVDAADYTVWRDGNSPDSTIVGYNLWANNFGNTSSTSTSVPEPSSLVLILLSGLGLVKRRSVGC